MIGELGWQRRAVFPGMLIAFLVATISIIDTIFVPLVESEWWARIWVVVFVGSVIVLLLLRQEAAFFTGLSFRARLPWRILRGVSLLILVLSVLKLPIAQDISTAVAEGLKSSTHVNTPAPLGARTFECEGTTPAQKPASMPSQNRSKTSESMSSSPFRIKCVPGQNVTNDKSVGSANDGLDKVQENLNRWGTMFAWLLAVVGLVIAFVINWVYAMAKDAKEQAAAVHGALDLNAKLRDARASLARAEIHADIASLLDDLDPDAHHVERQSLRSIRTLISAGESLLAPISDVAATADMLAAKALSLDAQMAAPLDSRFVRFLRDVLAPYLESLHERLCASRLAQSLKGQKCISEIENVWRLVSSVPTFSRRNAVSK